MNEGMTSIMFCKLTIALEYFASLQPIIAKPMMKNCKTSDELRVCLQSLNLIYELLLKKMKILNIKVRLEMFLGLFLENLQQNHR